MLAHLIKNQYEAQDPSDELDLVRGETVSLGPYHNGPSPKFGTMAERMELEGFLSGWLSTDR